MAGLRQKIVDSCLRPADDGFFTFQQNWALQQLLVLDQNLDDGLRIGDKVVRAKLQLIELGVLANQVLYGIFKSFNNRLEFFSPGRFLDIEDDIIFYSQFLSDRQGIYGRASVGVVVDYDF